MVRGSTLSLSDSPGPQVMEAALPGLEGDPGAPQKHRGVGHLQPPKGNGVQGDGAVAVCGARGVSW